MTYEKEIEKANTISDIFEIVKRIVREYLGHEQAGLMVGLTDLGAHQNGFIGAFYSLVSNMIILNKKPMIRILQTKPEYYNYYLFHVILHEYIHAIGSYDEKQTRQLVLEVSTHYFGDEHILTQFAAHIEKFIPHLSFPGYGYQLPEDLNIEFVRGIDKKNTDYIR
jgi:hypothetical protein